MFKTMEINLTKKMNMITYNYGKKWNNKKGEDEIKGDYEQVETTEEYDGYFTMCRKR